MKVLLIEDIGGMRALVIRVMMYLQGISLITLRERRELRDIACSDYKFQIILLYGQLEHWGDGKNYKSITRDVFRALQRQGVIVGISTDSFFTEEIEAALKDKAKREGRLNLHFVKGGKSLGALSSALDESLRLLEQAK